MKKVAIITGATGEIGREFVKQILRYDIDEVWAVARNEQKLYGLRDEYGEKVVPVWHSTDEVTGEDWIRNYVEDAISQHDENSADWNA